MITIPQHHEQASCRGNTTLFVASHGKTQV